MSGEGRTVWQAQDAAWWRRERIVLLGERFGSEGPAIANWLECEAKAQNAAGRVKAGYSTCARGAFADGGADRAREVVAYAVEIGFLEGFTEGDRTFTATIAAYTADQRTARAADRQARSRAGSVTERDMGAPSVTDRDEPSPTGEERREQEGQPRSSSELDRARIVRELFAYWQQQCQHSQAKLTPDRRRKCEARLREGYSEEQCRQAIDGAARAAFINDDGKRFDDFELIFRSGSKLESFIQRSDPTAAPGREPSSRELAAILNPGPAA